MKPIAAAVLLLATFASTAALADDQIHRLNNEVYVRIGAVEAQDTDDMPAFTPASSSGTSSSSTTGLIGPNQAGSGAALQGTVGFRLQPGGHGFMGEVQTTQISSSNLKTTYVTRGTDSSSSGSTTTTTNSSVKFVQKFSESNTFVNLGYGFAFDGDGMQLTPYFTFGDYSSKDSYTGLTASDGYVRDSFSAAYFGVGLRHQISLTPTWGLEADVAYEHLNLKWETSNSWAQDVSPWNDSTPQRRADGIRLGLTLTQQVWKNLSATYGGYYHQVSAAGTTVADTTSGVAVAGPITHKAGTGGVAAGLALAF